ncbi:MAG: transcription factor WhiB [Gemmatimonadales bacterium]|nr:transcription factor WhiB [Gemmatimonadales bacterium]
MTYTTPNMSGACHDPDVDPELFFPIGSTESGPGLLLAQKAIQVCQRCPIRSDCLDHAITKPEKFGIWGGTTEEERAPMRRSWQRRQHKEKQVAV